MSTVAQILTNLDRALWIVDNARIDDLPQVDRRGAVVPDSVGATPGAGMLAHEFLAKVIRQNPQGVSRRGLTTRLYLALQITAAFEGTAGIREMHKLATGNLPEEVKWDLGILTVGPLPGSSVQLSDKQLYKMNDSIHSALDPAQTGLTESERARRRASLNAITMALKDATLVVDPTGTSFAVDESGVWSWPKGIKKPAAIPPHDEVDALTPEQRRLRKAKGHKTPQSTPEEDDESERRYGPTDEDATDVSVAVPVPDEGAPSDGPTSPKEGTAAEAPAKRSRACTFAHWGAKTHKSGRTTGYHGYALHAVIRVPDLIRDGTGDGTTDNLAGPNLVQEFVVTPASTDVVDVTLRMVRRMFATGAPVVDFLGDRHYSYKAYSRWISQLWAMGVSPVMDLRKNDHGAFDYNGATVVDGTPHCGIPAGMKRIEGPSWRAEDDVWATFHAAVDEREPYAMQKVASAWKNDGATRWRCPARAGRVGCPRLAGSTEVAQLEGLPIVEPPSTTTPWCTAETAGIPAIKQMKYHQEHYWGSRAWRRSWKRRTYIEGFFGNLKNHRTGNIHRGFMQFTGEPLVTLAITAAVVAQNLRELENWHERASILNDPVEWDKLRKGEKERGAKTKDRLAAYEAHPLHQTTIHQFGFTMLSRTQKQDLDARCIAERAKDRPGLAA